jgi:hypothetical protein
MGHSGSNLHGGFLEEQRDVAAATQAFELADERGAIRWGLEADLVGVLHRLALSDLAQGDERKGLRVPREHGGEGLFCLRGGWQLEPEQAIGSLAGADGSEGSARRPLGALGIDGTARPSVRSTTARSAVSSTGLSR